MNSLLVVLQMSVTLVEMIYKLIKQDSQANPELAASASKELARLSKLMTSLDKAELDELKERLAK